MSEQLYKVSHTAKNIKITQKKLYLSMKGLNVHNTSVKHACNILSQSREQTKAGFLLHKALKACINNYKNEMKQKNLTAIDLSKGTVEIYIGRGSLNKRKIHFRAKGSTAFISNETSHIKVIITNMCIVKGESQ